MTKKATTPTENCSAERFSVLVTFFESQKYDPIHRYTLFMRICVLCVDIIRARNSMIALCRWRCNGKILIGPTIHQFSFSLCFILCLYKRCQRHKCKSQSFFSENVCQLFRRPAFQMLNAIHGKTVLIMSSVSANDTPDFHSSAMYFTFRFILVDNLFETKSGS